MSRILRLVRHGLPLLLAALLVACSGNAEEVNRSRRGGAERGPAGSRSGGGPPAMEAAVPVEVARVERRSISSYIETNGVLEADNEVDVVARVAAPIVELLAEEGDAVRRGRLLARLDDTEFRAQLEIARVSLKETQQALERAQRLFGENLISSQEFEQALAAHEAAAAQFQASQLQVDYTTITAPFDGMIIARYVDTAEQVGNGQGLFRISDFDPLLCPIQLPERELARLHVGQRAWLEVESWPGERFSASVLRISPVIDAATGTVKVTLAARPPERLRPGMFARVFVEAESKAEALVVPRRALSLESIGDTVYVAADGSASRREVVLGFQEGDHVELLSGVAADEWVVVVGQDGLSDGTPIQVLGSSGESRDAPALASGGPPAAGADAPPGPPGERRAGPPGQPSGGPGGPGGRRGPPDFASMTPEQLERVKERMRSRGMTEEQIEERIAQARERSGQPASE